MFLEIKHLDWERISDSDVLKNFQPELIIAADVIYDDTLFKPFCQTIDYIFENASPSCQLILAATVRNLETLDKFLIEIGKYRILEQIVLTQ